VEAEERGGPTALEISQPGESRPHSVQEHGGYDRMDRPTACEEDGIASSEFDDLLHGSHSGHATFRIQTAARADATGEGLSVDGSYEPARRILKGQSSASHALDEIGTYSGLPALRLYDQP
jgi:hypothetical protein